MAKTDQIAAAVKARLDRSISIGTFGVKLSPDARVPGSAGAVYWYDDDRLTYGQTAVEEQAIRAWLADFLGRIIVGYPIQIMDLSDRDGQRTLWFRRLKKKRSIKIPKRRK